MRLFHLLIVLCGIIVLPVYAQTKLTINNAVEIALENNLDLHKSKMNVKRAEVNVDESARIPNPEFTYVREDLKDSGHKYGEWSALGSIPLNFLWDRWSNIESKEMFIEAQQLLYEQNINELKASVKKVYYSYHKISELYSEIDIAKNKLNELVKTAKDRVDEGDISEYEYKRILIELNKLKLLTSEIELKRNNSENELNLLIGLRSNESFSTEVMNANISFAHSEEEIKQLAVENRKDIKAASLLVESQNRFLSNNKLKAIPKINLSAGYKQQSDNLKGSVVQVSFDVPLFKRNQNEIEHVEIEVNLLEREKIFLTEKIMAEAELAYKSYMRNKDLLQEGIALTYSDMFETATLTYLQGETSLIEFIDGINTYTSGLILTNQINTNYYQSLFELEKITATTFVNIEEN